VEIGEKVAAGTWPFLKVCILPLYPVLALHFCYIVVCSRHCI